MADVRVVLHLKEILAVETRNDQVNDRKREAAEAIADTAARLAPRDTGAMADSIHAEEQNDGTWRVSYDREHFYGVFQELGTEHHGPQPFLRPAAKRYEQGR